MNEKKFIDGLFTSRRESAPEFIIANLSFKTDKFIEWLKQNTNGRGYCNVDVQKSASGSLYATLNDWQPSNQSNSQEEKENDNEEIQVENIPFR